jgi:hypothetical protein
MSKQVRGLHCLLQKLRRHMISNRRLYAFWAIPIGSKSMEPGLLRANKFLGSNVGFKKTFFISKWAEMLGFGVRSTLSRRWRRRYRKPGMISPRGFMGCAVSYKRPQLMVSVQVRCCSSSELACQSYKHNHGYR